MSKTLIGYDGKPFEVGDRVELHPGLDLWMRGARYGEVVRTLCTPDDRVHVKLDRMPNRQPIAGPADRFRKI